MPFWFFVRVPELPHDVAHQSGQVQLIRYLVEERDWIEPGSGVALIENWWAEMRLEATSKGLVKKLLFEPHTAMSIGTPIAIVGCDGEEAPCGKPEVTLTVVRRIRKKPHARRSP